MADSNITAIGTLPRDPEIRYGAKGTAVCSFTIAVRDSYKQNDEWKEETAWMDCVAFGPLAENFAASATKGVQVICVGTLKQEEWDDKETGKKRSKLVLKCSHVGVNLKFARADVEKMSRETR